MDAPYLPSKPRITTSPRHPAPDAEPSRPEHDPRVALIREQVVHRLGSPADLFVVHVRPLWENHYRVNVFVGKLATSARISDSFFLEVEADGNLLTSTPAIAHRY